ncbi:unnamed protein product, partial [Gadus morhua 'NCC']
MSIAINWLSIAKLHRSLHISSHNQPLPYSLLSFLATLTQIQHWATPQFQLWVPPKPLFRCQTQRLRRAIPPTITEVELNMSRILKVPQKTKEGAK